MNNPYMDEAMRFLEQNDLKALPTGKHVINEGKVWVNIVEANLRPVEDALLEVHDRFIDIHVPFSCGESYGVRKRSSCSLPKGEIDTEEDILFFDDEFEEIITKGPGEITIFGPDTAHAPLIGEGKIRKAIFKVLDSNC